MKIESGNTKVDPTLKNEASEDPHSGGDFRSDKEDNISNTYLEHLNFVDAETAVVCMEDGLFHPASSKTVK